MDSILSYSEPFVIPDDREAIWDILVSLANHARSLDRRLSLIEGQISKHSSSMSCLIPPMNNTDQTKKDQEPRDSIDQLAEELRKVNITHERRHLAKSSFFLLIHSAVDPRLQNTLGDHTFMLSIFRSCKRPEFWQPSPLPVSFVTATDPPVPLIGTNPV